MRIRLPKYDPVFVMSVGFSIILIIMWLTMRAEQLGYLR